MTAELFKNISYALSGLALFLIAIKLMASSLKEMSGNQMARITGKLDQNKWMSLGLGIAFTTMIQSSDGAVALIIGLMAAGMLTLKAAIPFLLGANIGTTTTALIVAMSGMDKQSAGWTKVGMYFMLFAFIGAAIIMFTKGEKKANIGMLVFAIGAIFMGLEFLGSGMKGVVAEPAVVDVIKALTFNPWLALLTGTITTGLIQSSSAMTTIVQGIMGADPEAMTLQCAVAVVIGANIGTTFTALIASIGGKEDTKRVGVIWLTTNLAMAFILMPFIKWYAKLIAIMFPISINLQLAMAHLLFNTFMVAVFIWLTGPLEKFACWVIKTKSTTKKYEIHLPEELIDQSVHMAFEAAHNAAATLALITHDSINNLYNFLTEKDKKYHDDFIEHASVIDIIRDKLNKYLVLLAANNMTEDLAKMQMRLILALRSLERIPVLGVDIAKSLSTVEKKGVFDIPDEQYNHIKAMLKVLLVMVEKDVIQISQFSPEVQAELNTLYNKSLDQATEYSKAAIEKELRQTKTTSFDILLTYKQITRITHHCLRIGNYMDTNYVDERESFIMSDKLKAEIEID